MNKEYQYIEFVALPGSGKSTISLELFNELRKHSKDYTNITYDVSRKNKLTRILHKIKYILSAVYNDFAWCLVIQKNIFNSRQKCISDLIKVSMNYFFVYGVIIEAVKKNKKIILDQGLFQAIWSINYSAKNKICIQSLIPPKYSFHYIVELISDNEIIINRLNTRTVLDSRMQKINSKDCEIVINEHYRFITELKALISKKNIKHVELENNFVEDISKNTKILVDLLV